MPKFKAQDVANAMQGAVKQKPWKDILGTHVGVKQHSPGAENHDITICSPGSPYIDYTMPPDCSNAKFDGTGERLVIRGDQMYFKGADSKGKLGIAEGAISSNGTHLAVDVKGVSHAAQGRDMSSDHDGSPDSLLAQTFHLQGLPQPVSDANLLATDNGLALVVCGPGSEGSAHVVAVGGTEMPATSTAPSPALSFGRASAQSSCPDIEVTMVKAQDNSLGIVVIDGATVQATPLEARGKADTAKFNNAEVIASNKKCTSGRAKYRLKHNDNGSCVLHYDQCVPESPALGISGTHPSESSQNSGIILGVSIAGILGIAILAVVFIRYMYNRFKKPKPPTLNIDNGSSDEYESLNDSPETCLLQPGKKKGQKEKRHSANRYPEEEVQMDSVTQQRAVRITCLLQPDNEKSQEGKRSKTNRYPDEEVQMDSVVQQRAIRIIPGRPTAGDDTSRSEEESSADEEFKPDGLPDDSLECVQYANTNGNGINVGTKQ